MFLHGLIQASLLGPGRLCPYCVVVWAVTVALHRYVTLRSLRHGGVPVPEAGRRLALVLETHGLLRAAWHGLIAGLVLTRFWPYWGGLAGPGRPVPPGRDVRPM